MGQQSFQQVYEGVFSPKPALPKYGLTWDALVVLKSQNPTEALTSLALSCNLAMLMVLLTGHRGQVIHSLETGNLECSDQAFVLFFNQLFKTSRPGRHWEEVVLPALDQDKGFFA